MYKLNYFVPIEAKESTKQALFDIGVGRYENYECCSFETLGTGQFKPINNANPHIGQLDKIEKVQEFKVEVICSTELIKKSYRSFKRSSSL